MRALLIAVLLLLAAPAAASACSCIVPGKPRQEIKKADAAAFVKVTKRKALGSRGPYAFDSEVRYTLRVIRDYKNNLPKTITIKTNTSSASCGIDARVGQKLGFLLSRSGKGKYSASLCSIRSRKQLDAGTKKKARASASASGGSGCTAA